MDLLYDNGRACFSKLTPPPGKLVRAIAFGSCSYAIEYVAEEGVVPTRSLELDPCDVSWRTTLRAGCRRMATLPELLSLRLRAASSRKDRTSCQWRLSPMARWVRTVASRTSSVGTQDRAKYLVSEVVPSAVLRVTSTRAKAFRSRKS